MSRARWLVSLVVVALVVGAGTWAWSSRGDDIRTTALVRAAEGTWSCASDDWEVLVGGRWTIEIDRSGLFRATFIGNRDDSQEFPGIWTIDDGELAISTFGGVSAWQGIPDELRGAQIAGAWRGSGREDDPFNVEVVSPREVRFIQRSTAATLTCEKSSSRRPDIRQGVQG